MFADVGGSLALVGAGLDAVLAVDPLETSPFLVVVADVGDPGVVAVADLEHDLFEHDARAGAATRFLVGYVLVVVENLTRRLPSAIVLGDGVGEE